MRRFTPVLWLTTLGLLLTPAEAGHELPVYPSYYPQEIRVEAVDPAQAGARLADASIHAYLGAEPAGKLPGPDTVSAIESFGSYLVLTFDPGFVQRHEREARCAAAATLGRRAAVGAGQGRFVFHPYPVTPYHADYLHHFDLAEAAKRRYLSAAPQPGGERAPALRVRGEGPLAERLFGPSGPVGVRHWDATAAEVPAAGLLAAHAFAMNGWLGPAWMKEGWFQALALLGGTLSDAGAREAAESLALRLKRGEYGAPEERLDLERALVTRLASGCERVVLGYAVKREFVNTAFSPGIENIAYDSQLGLDSPLFIRTAKLKDFPWNGWLRIGIAAAPRAAWNPMGGFTDPAGRLIWYAVGDPALLPSPYGPGWVPNRIVDVRAEPRR
ncbi:MAG TPA: hypothetical protein VFO18_07140 [Methylomirabilota bacterium]|nr:hypothetical protein [Methylomirabilota bacterium]